MLHYTESGLLALCDNGLVAETDGCPCAVQWVAGGNDTVLTSLNGIDWKERTSSQSYKLGVAYNGSLWVMAGSGIATSSDGINWTVRTSPFTGVVRDVVWNGSVWVAGGEGNVKIATSPDGINWTARTTQLDAVYGLAYNGSYFIACGKKDAVGWVALSSNGTNWTEYTTPFDIHAYSAAWNGAFWVLAGSGIYGAATSPDGINWTERISPLPSGWKVAWNGFLWVIGGGGAFNLNIATSPDGINWTGRTTPFSHYSWDVAWDGSLWIACGSWKGVATSPDGVVWTSRYSTNNMSCIASKTAPSLYPPIG